MGINGLLGNAGGDALEVGDLGLRQRLGQLEHARHVLAAVGEVVVGQTA